MLASVPNLFYVIGLPVLLLVAVCVVCWVLYQVLGSVLHERPPHGR